MRMAAWTPAAMANARIKKHCMKVNYLTFIDISRKMLKNGQLAKHIFDKDQIHLNQNGYKICLSAIKDHL